MILYGLAGPRVLTAKSECPVGSPRSPDLAYVEASRLNYESIGVGLSLRRLVVLLYSVTCNDGLLVCSVKAGVVGCTSISLMLTFLGINALFT